MSESSKSFFEEAAVFLPKYLSPEKQGDLFAELKSFPKNMRYYTQKMGLQEDILQGDGWKSFTAIDFETRASKIVSGLILSNSCDIDPANKRSYPVKVLFSPLVSLEKFSALMSKKGIPQKKIDAFLTNVRKQRITSMFYLPKLEDHFSEYIVLLDDIHSQPLQSFLDATKENIFTLSQYGFYLLLFKLSIHFSRFQEDVDRL